MSEVTTLEIGVWTIECSKMALVYRVGMVKCVPHQLDMFQNRIGVIKEITGLSHEEEMECHQSAHMKERMHNMTQIIDDSLNIKSHDDTVVTGTKRKRNPTKKGKTEKSVVSPLVAERLSKWAEVTNERFNVDDAKKSSKKENAKKSSKKEKPKPPSDISCHLAVDGFANIVFTDGMVRLVANIWGISDREMIIVVARFT